MVFLFFFTAVIWWVVFQIDDQKELRVTFLDVGQGDAILIEAPNGNQILIDTGPNKKVLESLGKILPIYDKSIDGILLTHPDLDHIGGTVPVFDIFEIDYLFTASSSKKTDVTEAIDNLREPERVELWRGDKIILDTVSDVYLEILFPDKEFVKNIEDANDRSIVTKLVYGETCFIFTGDASKMIELFIVSKYGSNDYLKCELLKAGHHGSDTSTAEEFVGFVSPKYGIISTGKDNKFGHPHQEVLDVFHKFNVEVLNTAEEGNIGFYSDGENLFLRE